MTQNACFDARVEKAIGPLLIPSKPITTQEESFARQLAQVQAETTQNTATTHPPPPPPPAKKRKDRPGSVETRPRPATALASVAQGWEAPLAFSSDHVSAVRRRRRKMIKLSSRGIQNIPSTHKNTNPYMEDLRFEELDQAKRLYECRTCACQQFR